MDAASEALKKHREWQGKLETVNKMPIETADDLSIAYTPGVAAPCLEIARDPSLSYVYTGRGHTIAVISDGSAVLGLGNIGPEAGMPVMEGKCVLFKAISGLDAVTAGAGHPGYRPAGGCDFRPGTVLWRHQPGGHRGTEMF